MRILITGRGQDAADRPSPGIFEWDQAKALKAAGHDVRFAAIDIRSLRRRRPLGCREYVLDGIPVYYCALPTGVRPFWFGEWVQRRAAELLWRQIRRSGWQPEVVHSHFGAGFLPLAGRLGIPRVYTEHFSWTNQADPPLSELRRERRTYAMTEQLLCVSRPLADNVLSHTGVRARVVHNVVDTDTFSRPETAAPPSGPFRFAAAGNLIERKGYDLLLTALAEIRRRGHDAVLTVVGGGEEEPALKEQARRLDLAERVEFLGRQPRTVMAEVYRRSDAFVLPSRRETFGVVYIEAMAAGLPVIATACGGPEDFVDETNGLLIPPEDAASLADAMERMIRTRARYDGAAIARFARESFSPSAIAARLTAVYEEVLSC